MAQQQFSKSRLAGVQPGLAGESDSFKRLLKWAKGWPGIGLLVVAIIALGFVFLWVLPGLLTPQTIESIPLSELQNEIRRTWAQVLLGIVVLGTFVVTWWRASLAEKAVEIASEQQITERFTRAIDQLGNQQSMAIRLGGIYALERIAKDSARDHWQVMEVLTAYVREHSSWAGEVDGRGTPVSVESERPEIRTDIQAIIAVIARRDADSETTMQRLDLRRTDLRHAAFFAGNLRKAGLLYANLRGANLFGANLQEIRLDGANLQQVNLRRANLQGANLENFVIQRALLEGTNLSEAQGLTQEQIDSATTDETTILPDYLKLGE